MKDGKKSRRKRKALLTIYVIACLFVVVFAYAHLSKIARDYNTQHMELITGIYAEKVNDAMEYVKNYATEEAKLIETMAQVEPENVLEHMQERLDQMSFANRGLILSDQEILGNTCAVNDIKKLKLDQQALISEESFISDPYQSSETGTMVLTVFVPVKDSDRIKSLYVSITMEDIRKLGSSDLLWGKVDVHLLKADSENYITCISTDVDKTGNWNNLLLQQKYFTYYNGYSYKQWVREMQSGKTNGNFSARIKDKVRTISYQSIQSMPGWYVVVELANEDVADITRQFSEWGGIYGGILFGITVWYMMTIVVLESRDKKHYMGLSSTDALTGILNRSAFQRAVEEALSKKITGILVFVDVDNFKKCNDAYGHQNGDFCLIHFVNTMKKCFPKDTILGRYGGDEFIVYMENVTAKQAKQYMAEFQCRVADLQLPTGEEIKVSASAGGAVYPSQGQDYVSLCRRADTMLYEVKKNGKDGFKVEEI